MTSTLDIAVARELLGNLLEFADEQSMYLDEVEDWRQLRDTLPAYRLTDEGAVAEWIPAGTRDNDAHRHHSHLYGLFPGREIHPDSSLAAAFAVAARHRLERGLAAQTSWSLVSLAHVFARLGDGERALECLDVVARLALLPNLLTLHNDWRGMVGLGEPEWSPFQIDANLGWTSAVQEMLVGWHGDVIRLLPALPARWDHGRVDGLRCPGGLSVSVAWAEGGRRINVTISAPDDRTIRLRTPSPVQVLDSSEREPTRHTVAGREILVHVDARVPLTLELLSAARES